MKGYYQGNSVKGCLKDAEDTRDYEFRQIAKTPLKKLPSLVDLSSGCSTVENQGSLGSCTANALVGALEYLENKERVQMFEELSRLFVYYNERVIMRTVNEDSGASLRTGCKVLADYGVCSEKLWSYRIADFAMKPPEFCYSEALNHQLLSYWRIETGNIEQMRQCLADGYPFVFGFKVMPNFYRVKDDGKMPMPRCYENLLKAGGHAVMAVGYNDNFERIKVRNSWGTDWGKEGYFFMPYRFIKNHTYCWDFWTLRDME